LSIVLAADHHHVDSIRGTLGRAIAERADVHPGAADALIDQVATNRQRPAEAETPRLAAGFVAARRIGDDLQPRGFVALQFGDGAVERRLGVTRQLGGAGGEWDLPDATFSRLTRRGQ
jgi:hypothetical protein